MGRSHNLLQNLVQFVTRFAQSVTESRTICYNYTRKEPIDNELKVRSINYTASHNLLQGSHNLLQNLAQSVTESRTIRYRISHNLLQNLAQSVTE